MWKFVRSRDCWWVRLDTPEAVVEYHNSLSEKQKEAYRELQEYYSMQGKPGQKPLSHLAKAIKEVHETRKKTLIEDAAFWVSRSMLKDLHDVNLPTVLFGNAEGECVTEEPEHSEILLREKFLFPGT